MTITQDTKITLSAAILVLATQGWILKQSSDAKEAATAQISVIRDDLRESYVSKELVAAQLEAVKVQIQGLDRQMSSLRDDLLRLERRLDGNR